MKSIGSAGRFGPRAGSKIRKLVSSIEVAQKDSYICGKCQKKAVKRVSFGIWQCRFCQTKFTGEAYRPASDSMKRVQQALAKSG